MLASSLGGLDLGALGLRSFGVLSAEYNSLGSRLLANPGRFQPWPEDALLNVAQKFLAKLDELGAQERTSRGLMTCLSLHFSFRQVLREGDESSWQDSPARLAIVDFFPYSFEASYMVLGY